jgi:hypothetical protein
MYENARTRGVSQEGEAEAGTDGCPLNQPWEISDRWPTSVVNAKFENAQVRLKGGEGVVADLWLCRCERSEKGGLPSVRQPNKANVSDQSELESHLAQFARLPFLCVSRRLMCCRSEVRIPEAATAAAHQEHVLLTRDQVCDQVSTLCIKDCRAWWHTNDQVAPSLTVRRFVPALARVTRYIPALHLKVAQGGLPRINRNVDAAAASTVAAIRAATRYMRLTTHR